MTSPDFYPSSEKQMDTSSPYIRGKKELQRPKKPLSAYIYFSQEYREMLKEEHPNWTSNDIMKHVSSKWSHMDKDEKQPYNDLA